MPYKTLPKESEVRETMSKERIIMEIKYKFRAPISWAAFPGQSSAFCGTVSSVN